MPAAMIPGPAPVTTIHPWSASTLAMLARLLVERIVGMRAGRAEDRHLRDVAVGGERPERGSHLLERGVGDLQVEAIGAVAGQTDCRGEDLEQLVAVASYPRGVE